MLCLEFMKEGPRCWSVKKGSRSLATVAVSPTRTTIKAVRKELSANERSAILFFVKSSNAPPKRGKLSSVGGTL